MITVLPKHCHWFSPETGRCLHKTKAENWWSAWCCSGQLPNGDYGQVAADEATYFSCDHYKPVQP